MNNNTFTLRDAHAHERDAIRDVTLAAYEQFATLMVPSAWAALRQALLLALDAPGPVERIVATGPDGALRGSVLLFPAGQGLSVAAGRMPWPELRLLAVAPNARNQGVGAALIGECARRTRAAGFPALGLHTSDSMRAALRLYQRLGFERAPEYDFQPPGAEVVMGYSLRLDAED